MRMIRDSQGGPNTYHPAATKAGWGSPDFQFKKINKSQGFTLIELLTALVIIVVASISALSYFQYGLGGIHQEGNRRAALEIARGRMDQLLRTKFNNIKPDNFDETLHLKCQGCTGDSYNWSWDKSHVTPFTTDESVPLNEKGNRKMQTKVQWKDDSPANNPPAVDKDILEISVKVWYRGDTADLDSNRVELRSLRAKG